MSRQPLAVLVLAASVACASALAGQQQAPPADGATLFHESGCEHCHGAHLEGTSDHGPALLTVGRRLSAEQIARQIRDGGQSMPSFADSLNPPDVEALVAFLAAHKRAPKGVKAATPAFTEPPAAPGARP